MEFAIGGDLAEKENEQIDFEAWDYHWVSKPGSLTWYTLDTHSAHHLYAACEELSRDTASDMRKGARHIGIEVSKECAECKMLQMPTSNAVCETQHSGLQQSCC